MLRLILFRHGQTNWNAEGRVQGGGSLDDTGRRQVEALARKLEGKDLAAVYSSPALRAIQTARAVARRHSLAVRPSRLLRDLDYGVYGGALLRDLEAQSPGLVNQWRTAPHSVHFPGGDSLADLRRRVTRFVARLTAKHPDQTVAAATHDSPIRMLASIALGLDDAQHTRQDLVAPLASMHVLEVDSSQLRLIVHNDTSHLRGL